MTPETVMTIGQHALEMTLMLAAPLLLVGAGGRICWSASSRPRRRSTR